MKTCALEFSMKKCLKCKKNTGSDTRKFCSMDCRRFYLSQMMIDRSVEIKKKFGNSYYHAKIEE